jgi:hypothetical protein
MKPVRWSAHVEASLRDREIDRAQAERTLEAPDRRLPGRGGREMRLRKYHDDALQQPMVLCVVVEERANETVVVIVYESSKIEKYLTGGTT